VRQEARRGEGTENAGNPTTIAVSRFAISAFFRGVPSRSPAPLPLRACICFVHINTFIVVLDEIYCGKSFRSVWSLLTCFDAKGCFLSSSTLKFGGAIKTGEAISFLRKNTFCPLPWNTSCLRSPRPLATLFRHLKCSRCNSFLLHLHNFVLQ